MKIRMIQLIVASLCLALVPAPAALSAPVGGPKPTITITAPQNGARIHGSTITVQVSVSNFKLVKPVLLLPNKWSTIPLLPGNQGHIHYALDSPANLVLTRDVVVSTSHTWTNVTPGPHTVIAYLANSQHARFPGTQPATVHVTVVPRRAAPAAPRHVMPKPSIRITGAETRSTARGTALVVHTAVSNFKLVPPVYQNPPKLPDNEGHIHYVLDNLNNFLATRDAVTALYHPWLNVSPGKHTIIAYLATSQHQRVPGTAAAQTQIYVPARRARGHRSTVRVVAELPRTGGAADRLWAPIGLREALGGLLLLALGLVMLDWRWIRRSI